MDEAEKRSLVDRYLACYNAFDVDGMMAVMHPDIEFNNISGGEVTATASGAEALRRMAEQSKALFTSRKQVVLTFRAFDDEAVIEVAYEGVLARDLPNGMQAGETLRLKGRSEFTFRDGKIYRLTDSS